MAFILGSQIILFQISNDVSLIKDGVTFKVQEQASVIKVYCTNPRNFIIGYMLPMIPVSILQTVVCYLAASVLGLKMSVNVIMAVLVNIPSALLYIGIGLLCGSVLNDKQVGGICGALLGISMRK